MRPDDTAPDGAVRIPLRAHDGSVRAYALVDAADAEWVNQWRWCLRGDARYVVRGALVGGIKKTRYLHRELMGCAPGDGVVIDHINRDRLDNRRANLHRGTQSENIQNTSPRPRTSQYRGVSWIARDRRWMACVKVGGKTRSLGYFTDEQEAAEAARAARLAVFPHAHD